MMDMSDKVRVKFDLGNGSSCSTILVKKELYKVQRLLNENVGRSNWVVITGEPELWVRIDLIRSISFTKEKEAQVSE